MKKTRVAESIGKLEGVKGSKFRYNIYLWSDGTESITKVNAHGILIEDEKFTGQANPPIKYGVKIWASAHKAAGLTVKIF